ncbi:sulfite exporter TauE/SafE family protein [bacterium]|nr:sulfite exporter TauE/SafE family protein [bacterium]
MTFDLWVLLVAVLAGGVAAISGFGIGSLLTPLLVLQLDTKLAVAVVAIPHAAATAYRFWLLRAHLDRGVLAGFGVSSAIGGLLGAVLHAYAPVRALTLVFGLLLVFVGASGLSGLAEHLRFRGPWAWGAGALSGLLGGLVGNQGGIRSAALLGFDVSKEAFVATATAVGLLVDAARLPVYLATQGAAIAGQWSLVAIATVGVLVGTVAGSRVLRRIPDAVYRPMVSGIILALGLAMLARALL